MALGELSRRLHEFSPVSIIPSMLYKKKVMFALEQATKSQRRSRSIALLFL